MADAVIEAMFSFKEVREFLKSIAHTSIGKSILNQI